VVNNNGSSGHESTVCSVTTVAEALLGRPRLRSSGQDTEGKVQFKVEGLGMVSSSQQIGWEVT